MDYKFLNKVVDQIVNETTIDHRRNQIGSVGKIRFSFLSPLINLSSLPHILYSTIFIERLLKHCREVYGLNKEESIYVWNKYSDIIKDKVYGNNG